jgi:methionyl-tRNA formyltransferase
MRIDAGMDTGDILLQHEYGIEPNETAAALTTRLSEAGASLMAETLRGLAAGNIIPRPQDHSQATLAPILKRDDGRIDWNRTAQEIHTRMRGFAPWPGAYSVFRGQSCHLWGEPVSNEKRDAPPGTLHLEGGNLLAVCGGATVFRLLAVKLEGRKQVSAFEFANGARLKPGERFGDS